MAEGGEHMNGRSLIITRLHTMVFLYGANSGQKIVPAFDLVNSSILQVVSLILLN